MEDIDNMKDKGKLASRINTVAWVMTSILVMIIIISLPPETPKKIGFIGVPLSLIVPFLFVLSTYLDDSNDFREDLTKKKVILKIGSMVMFSIIVIAVSFIIREIFLLFFIFKPILPILSVVLSFIIISSIVIVVGGWLDE